MSQIEQLNLRNARLVSRNLFVKYVDISKREAERLVATLGLAELQPLADALPGDAKAIVERAYSTHVIARGEAAKNESVRCPNPELESKDDGPEQPTTGGAEPDGNAAAGAGDYTGGTGLDADGDPLTSEASGEGSAD
jgi:hypothetical protein